MAEERPRALLLDTHVWIWVVEGVREALWDATIGEVEKAGKRGDVLVSAISVWEVAMLETKGRLSLNRPIDEWVADALRAAAIRLVPITPEIAVESTRLPGDPHGDPADRILIASARAVDARLVTCDGAIVAYAETGHVGVLDGRG